VPYAQHIDIDGFMSVRPPRVVNFLDGISGLPQRPILGRFKTTGDCGPPKSRLLYGGQGGALQITTNIKGGE
jgi:hypothetical protein